MNSIGGRIATLDREEYLEDANRTKYHSDRLYMMECWFASHYNGYITTCFSPCPFPDCVHFISGYALISGLRQILIEKQPGYQKEAMDYVRLRLGKKLCKV